MGENLSQKAYWHIHDKLSAGTLKPGFRLSNRAVAKEVGISFTPVREALNRLVSEGLLEYRAGLGVFVPECSRREIEELYEVREMLECAAVDGAGPVGRLCRIALPCRLGALAVAWLVALAIGLGDLAASVLVMPPGVTTLSIHIFNLLHYGVEDRVAGICLALMALFAAVVAGIAWLASRWRYRHRILSWDATT